MKRRSSSAIASRPARTQTKLVVVADLGRMRAYRITESPQFSRPQWERIEDRQTAVTRRLSEELTDQAGRFRKEPASAGADSDGEEHNLELERRSRAVKTIARRIDELIEQEGVEAIYFAADERINHPLIGAMNEATRSRIQRNISANLTRLDPNEIIDRFVKEERRHAPQ